MASASESRQKLAAHVDSGGGEPAVYDINRPAPRAHDADADGGGRAAAAEGTTVPPSYDDCIRMEAKSPDGSESGDSDLHKPEAELAAEWHEERAKRETWTGGFDFILSCIGYAVGLGNVWRFPYLCYSNGGGAFLVPYFTFLILCGMPLTMLELCMGQFSSLGPTALFQKFCPLLQGMGWSQVLISGICCIYYNVIIAWTLYYLYSSFSFVLPWSNCDNGWNTAACVRGIKQQRRWAAAANESDVLLGANGTDYSVAGLNAAWLGDVNFTENGTEPETETASEQYWKRHVLQLSASIDDIGSIRTELLVSFVVAWCLIYCCLFKGVKSSGRVVYVTATFPYVVLVILCCRGLTLPGAFDGIYYYFVPRWAYLLDIKVWVAAASQIFYSVGAAWGVMLTFSSFNKFSHNCYRDAIIIPLINCFTSVFAGIVVFSIIGFMAHESGMHVEDVIKSGPGLAFVVYPEAVANFPLSPLWSMLFFLMLLTIGVDSQFGMFETFVTAFVDTWPRLLARRKPQFTLLMCCLFFVLGLPLITNGGIYILTLMDWYSATFALMIVGTIEILLVSRNYGHERFMADISLMTRQRVHWWWPLCWRYVTPTVVILLFGASIIGHAEVKYAGERYPRWAVAAGWSLAMAAIVPIPLYAAYNMLFWASGSITERLQTCLRPTPDYGPSRLGDRVRFRKSMNTVPGRQLYVLGVERQETEMNTLSAKRESCADFKRFIEEVHERGDSLDQ